MDIVSLAQLLFSLESLLFLCAVFMHLVKKNTTLMAVYVIESLTVVTLLFVVGISKQAHGLVLAAALSFVIKAVLAPIIFTRSIRMHDEKIVTGTYLNTPLTLMVMLMMLLFAQSDVFASLSALAPDATQFVHLALAGIFVSLFLAVNQKGIFHQIIGVLSMENCIVALGLFLGIEHTFALELGILFDILLWMVGASVFIALIHYHFGTLDTSVIKDLRD